MSHRLAPQFISYGHLTEQDNLFSLIDNVSKRFPHHIPDVTTGSVTPLEWFHRKKMQDSFVARVGDTVVAHVAVRSRATLPDGRELPSPYTLEVCRLLVDPTWGGLGVAENLMRTAMDAVGSNGWLTTHKGGVAQQLFDRLGWSVLTDDVVFLDDSAEGVCMVVDPCAILDFGKAV